MKPTIKEILENNRNNIKESVIILRNNENNINSLKKQIVQTKNYIEQEHKKNKYFKCYAANIHIEAAQIRIREIELKLKS